MAATGRHCKGVSKLYALIILIFYLSIFNLQSHSQSVWTWVEPKPTGNLLHSVHFINQSTGYACGVLGTVIKTTSGGNEWTLLNSSTAQNLSAIFFTDEKSGFATGEEGTIIFTKDGGGHWMLRSSGTEFDLHDITFTNKTTGYACGLNGTVLRTTDRGSTWNQLMTNTNAPLFCISFLNENTGVAGGYNIIIKTTNGGMNWTTLNANIVPSSSVVGVIVTDSNTVYAGGNSPGGIIYKSTNGGSDWQSISLGLPYLFGGSVDLLRSIGFVNSNTGFAVTDFGTILKSSDAGISWNRDSSFRPSYEKLSVMYDIQVLDSYFVHIAGGGGTVIGSSDAGLNWFALTGNKRSLRADYFIDRKTGYCSGEDGVILKTSDGGFNWISLRSPADIFFKSVFFLNEHTGFIGGDSGKILKTTDGGNSYSDQFTTRQQNVNSIYFIDQNTGITAGGSDQRAFIYRTSNGGDNWYEAFDSLSYGDLNCIGAVNGSTLIIAGDHGNIVRTTDAGVSWNSINISPLDLKSISFSDNANGMIAGAKGSILKTTDSGISWIWQQSPTFRDLNSVKYSSNGSVISAGANGVIIRSKNGGMSWTLEQGVTDNDFYSVNIPFSNNFIAVGEYGTITNSVMKIPSAIAFKYDPVMEAEILEGNYPNPFNPVTNIKYKLVAGGFVALKVYNILGEEVAMPVNEKQKPGSHVIPFDGSGLASGIYFYSLYLDGKSAGTNRMLLLK